jgi:3-deoxy-7-phosphoheptulonate synthase
MSEFAMRVFYGPIPKYDRVRTYKRKNNDFIILGGPCSVESDSQINMIAESVAKSGATHLRGGIFRAGTYPGENFGYVKGELIAAYSMAAKMNGLKNIIECLDYSDASLDLINTYGDCVQVGCRQMQNYTLLQKVARLGKPMFLKRHPGSTLHEFLGAAEYLLKYSTMEHPELYLIERGSVSHVQHCRWDLSISMIPAIKAVTQLPVIVDASHGTGRRDLVEPMTLAGVAAGAAGCLIECHPTPEKSLSDAEQAISLDQFGSIINKAKKIREVIA